MYDPRSRVNAFAHVNHTAAESRLGILLCINGTGSSYAWIRKILIEGRYSYEEMNRQAEKIVPGSRGLFILPFGNGAERMLENKNPGCLIDGVSFNIHCREHLFRAVQEAVAYSFYYGIKILNEIDLHAKVIRAGKTNLFQSDLFCNVLSSLTDSRIELYNTDGSAGAARGAAFGGGFYNTLDECFKNLKIVDVYNPDSNLREIYIDLYEQWEILLSKFL
jgi:xylulokinase